MFDTAALVLAADAPLDVELLPVEAAVLVAVDLRVESVTFELELGLRVADVLVLFIEVETTVMVEEGIKEVDVLVATAELLL
jgi:hypothetical protein